MLEFLKKIFWPDMDEVSPDEEVLPFGENEPESKTVKQDIIHRPQTWEGFIGNRAVVERLRELVRYHRITGNRMDNVLLEGPPGTGKTTLAKLLANEIGGYFWELNGATIKTPRSLFTLVNEIVDLQAEGHFLVIFIDEFHDMLRNTEITETMKPLLEDYVFKTEFQKEIIRLWSGPKPGQGEITKIKSFIRNVAPYIVQLRPLIFIGATTEEILDRAVKRRFTVLVLEPYNFDEIQNIAKRFAMRNGIEIETDALKYLAERSRFSPATAIQRVQECFRYQIVRELTEIDTNLIREVFKRNGVYDYGIEKKDIYVLETLAKRDKPMGIDAIMAALPYKMPRKMVEELESFLIPLDFAQRTPRGRMITEKGRRFLDSLK